MQVEATRDPGLSHTFAATSGPGSVVAAGRSALPLGASAPQTAALPARSIASAAPCTTRQPVWPAARLIGRVGAHRSVPDKPEVPDPARSRSRVQRHPVARGTRIRRCRQSSAQRGANPGQDRRRHRFHRSKARWQRWHDRRRIWVSDDPCESPHRPPRGSAPRRGGSLALESKHDSTGSIPVGASREVPLTGDFNPTGPLRGGRHSLWPADDACA